MELLQKLVPQSWSHREEGPAFCELLPWFIDSPPHWPATPVSNPLWVSAPSIGFSNRKGILLIHCYPPRLLHCCLLFLSHGHNFEGNSADTKTYTVMELILHLSSNWLFIFLSVCLLIQFETKTALSSWWMTCIEKWTREWYTGYSFQSLGW